MKTFSIKLRKIIFKRLNEIYKTKKCFIRRKQSTFSVFVLIVLIFYAKPLNILYFELQYSNHNKKIKFNSRCIIKKLKTYMHMTFFSLLQGKRDSILFLNDFR